MNAAERALALAVAAAMGVLWGALSWIGLVSALWLLLLDVFAAITAIGPVPLASGAVALCCVLAFVIRLEEC